MTYATFAKALQYRPLAEVLFQKLRKYDHIIILIKKLLPGTRLEPRDPSIKFQHAHCFNIHEKCKI